MERAVDGDRYDRKLELSCKHECSSFERGQTPVPAARAFGEDDYAHAVVQAFLRFCYCLLDAVNGGVVNEDVSGLAAGVADQWYLFELLLHQPLEVVVEVAEYHPNIEGSLMVGHEYITLLRVEILAPIYLDAHEEEKAYAARPDVGRPICEHHIAAKRCADDGGQSCKDGDDQQDWCRNQPLVEKKQCFNHLIFLQKVKGGSIEPPSNTGHRRMNGGLTASSRF